MNLLPRMNGLFRAARAFTHRLASETRGNVAMIFGLSLPVLILMTMGGVDINRASTVRVNLQDALDAAALTAARSSYTRNEDIQRVGMAALRANLKNYPEILLREADTTFVLNASDVVVADAKVDVKTIVANIFLPPYGKFMDDYIKVGAHSEVDRSSRNVEVALVLDVTGSMQGDRISALIEASKDLVDLVVQAQQTPYYSKVALVPYSNSVNPGSYLNTVRGGITGSVNVTGAVMNLTGNQKTITAATKARPVVITSSSHGFSNGDVVWITGVSGMTQLNNKAYVVTNKTTNTFELYTTGGSRVDGRNYSNHSGSSGRVQKCQNNDCSVTITANGHGLSNNQYVRLTDIGGMTALNDKTYLVGNVTSNTYTIDPEDSTQLNPYTSGGKSWCAQQGCTWFAYENMYEDLQTNLVSGCVTERTGTNRYTDVAPTGGSRVGRHYPQDGSCLDDQILPLTSNATLIKNRIDQFEAVGGTAGQIGIGWGWYMLAPTFNSVWPTGAAGAYNSAQTLKAAVIMTDGEFNTPYCSGVISRDAGANSGSNTYKINCAPDNGDPFAQSRALCDGMRERGIVVYTVGLGISATGQAADVLRYCATTGSYFHMADDASDLAGAFAAIGRDITQLRISR
ncbi:MAG: ubiquitin-activating E1 FCCH domain-containing protein [Brevundimonas sp.]|uniref:ubiquitin-activating E1 FCCH domain-containing protein n=1 Tax=Brevundimonas sp. TaxID=1871086 RepID=UPI004033E353